MGKQSKPSYRPGHVVWRELMSTDFDRSKAFFTELFGWTATDMPMPESTYTIFSLGERGIAGGMQNPPESPAPSAWNSYVSVPDVDAALARATKLGGKALYEIHDMPDIGRFVGIMDPQGAVLSVMKGSKGDMPATMPETGDFCWETLSAKDVDAAKAYYTAVVGWKAGEGPGGMAVFKAGDSTVVDIQPARGDRSHWMTYVVVENIGDTCGKTERLGGKVLVPEFAIPEVGHIAVIQDPTGATIGLFKGGE